ncbi:MAG: N-acetylmuramoyl-L-alanine amidase [Armatimonadetes bacterium]|nr:N-acetylmuramoyl-L-alanine amidase [Armatimonadota bacterium]
MAATRNSHNHMPTPRGLPRAWRAATWLAAFAGLAISSVPMPEATWRLAPSPNWDQRAGGMRPDTVVIHSTAASGLWLNVRYLRNPESQVSSHFVIGKEGQIVQLVGLGRRAWHAGVSEMDGMRDVNSRSVGIELVNLNDGRDPYPEAQVRSAAALIRWMRQIYDIPDENIVTHAEVARPPGRKNDPAGFNLRALRRRSRPADE